MTNSFPYFDRVPGGVFCTDAANRHDIRGQQRNCRGPRASLTSGTRDPEVAQQRLLKTQARYADMELTMQQLPGLLMSNAYQPVEIGHHIRKPSPKPLL